MEAICLGSFSFAILLFGNFHLLEIGFLPPFFMFFFFNLLIKLQNFVNYSSKVFVRIDPCSDLTEN